MTIPASYSVESSPSVISAGGNALNLNGLLLTKSTRVPIGQVLSFPTGAAVSSYFGAASAEAVVANGGQTLGGNPAGTGYFGGYQNATAVPGALLVAQYPATAVAAWLRGGSLAAMTLAQLQALSGSLTVVMDGYSHVISSISFAGDNSFSAAAAAIQAAFTDPTESSFTASLGASFTATGTGTSFVVTSVTGILSVGDTVTGTGVPTGTTIVSGPSGGGAGTYTTSVATTAAAAACTSTSNVLNVTVDTDVAIAVGQTVTGASVAAGSIITALGTGTGGVGTYTLSGAQQHIASEAMTGTATAPLVTFDSVSSAFVVTSGITGAPSTAAFATGSLAASLLLTSATGAVLSQGAAATTPAAFMAGIIAQTTNWASFFTAFDPDGGNGNAQKLAFSAWTNSVAPRYAYLAWDTDITPTESVPASSSLGYQVTTALNYSGTVPIYEPNDLNHAAFLAGSIAAIDFTKAGGRISFAYKTQTGLAAAVTSITAAVNLGGNPQANGSFGNGYNFVGAFATANQGFVNYQRGSISGPFKWLDSYVNQIWLTNQFQLAAYEYMTQVGSFPYTPAGYANFEIAMQDVIQAGLSFGAYSAGVTLSSSEISEVNAAAGANIATTLQTQGWYLQVKDPGATARASRGSPIITFWYVDGGSVQALNIGSVAVQ
jgi:Protein of unknown function (DUF3383)